MISLNPADAIPFPKLEQTLPKTMRIDDIFRLLDTMKRDSWMDRRNLAMFETFYSTGIRIGELHMLNIQDIDFNAGLIRVIGKGNKTRTSYQWAKLPLMPSKPTGLILRKIILPYF